MKIKGKYKNSDLYHRMYEKGLLGINRVFNYNFELGITNLKRWAEQNGLSGGRRIEHIEKFCEKYQLPQQKNHIDTLLSLMFIGNPILTAGRTNHFELKFGHPRVMHERIGKRAIKRRLPDPSVTHPETYREYLASAKWKDFKLSLIRLRGNRCEVCNLSGRLDGHHITYARLGNELPEDVMLLCRSCHDLQHPEKRRYKKAA